MSAVKISHAWRGENVNVNLISFGYKKGVPNEADIVFDAREIKNPRNTKSLRHLSGKDVAVQKQVLAHPIAHRILAEAKEKVYAKEERGDHAIKLGIGCSYGRHRSVALVEILAEQLATDGHRMEIEHRDLERSQSGNRTRCSRRRRT